MEFIRQANLAKAREYLTDMTAFMRDRSGRSPLHMAVLYERRFVIKYLVKSYPATVHIKDDVCKSFLINQHIAYFLPCDAMKLSSLSLSNSMAGQRYTMPVPYPTRQILRTYWLNTEQTMQHRMM